MKGEIKSEGYCLYCNELLSKQEIGKHLAKHLAEMQKKVIADKTQTYCHIEIVADYDMFLHLLVKGNIKIEEIDQFLKDIWLECCGHMSGFVKNREEINMNKKVQDIFETGAKVIHDYDYGTTTRVFLKGLKHYQLNLKEEIILVSRNEPLEIMCAICKIEPAVNICTCCSYQEYAYFCKKCSKKHAKVCDDFADYSSMPVVNSPRMGECGYTGGSIDLERDGVFKKK